MQYMPLFTALVLAGIYATVGAIHDRPVMSALPKLWFFPDGHCASSQLGSTLLRLPQVRARLDSQTPRETEAQVLSFCTLTASSALSASA